MAEFYMKDIRAWRDATLMLTFEERGYFDELLSLIYMYDDCLPDNDDLICKAMPVSKRQHKRLRDKLIELKLIEIIDGFYFNNRSTKELVKINSKSTINKVNSAKRWAKSRKTKDTSDASAMPSVIPIVKVKVNSEKKDKYIKDFEDFWIAYGRVGSRKKALDKYIIVRRTVDQEIILEAITRYNKHLKEEEWKKKRNCCIWLNQEGWADVFEIKQKRRHGII